MKRIATIYVLTFSQISYCAESTEELSRFAKVISYPIEQLRFTDVTQEETKLEAVKIAKAVRIDAVDKLSFYPLIISVAKKGAFYTEEIRRQEKQLMHCNYSGD